MKYRVLEGELEGSSYWITVDFDAMLSSEDPPRVLKRSSSLHLEITTLGVM